VTIISRPGTTSSFHTTASFAPFAVTKPKERSPILPRRSKLISYLDKQLAKVHQFKAGSDTGGAQFWLDPTGATFLDRSLDNVYCIYLVSSFGIYNVF